MSDKEKGKLYLNNVWITILFIYYLGIFLLGFKLSLNVLTSDMIKEGILYSALCGSAGMALNGSSIFYIRKLYKLCFNNNKLDTVTTNNYKEKLATLIYFFARPLFSLGFSFLIVIGFKTGFMSTSATEVKLNEGFVFLTMFLSFFVGFLTGEFIKKLEKDGSNIIKEQIDPNKTQ